MGVAAKVLPLLEFSKILGSKNLDLDQLYFQKCCLVRQIWNYPNDDLWGLVHFLDDILDEAEKLGWKHPITEDKFWEQDPDWDTTTWEVVA